MKKLSINEGLLLTDMEIQYKGRNLHLTRVLIDTGSSSSIISSEIAEMIGIFPEAEDPIYRVYGIGGSEIVYSKILDSIHIGQMKAEQIEMEIGEMDYDFQLDGIIGLNLLMRMKALINIEKLLIQSES
ncbi:aspartyl protease family protein [Ureibacillus chungkukjangi]|uniref:Gag-polyprotein putative aspartyl protease n=1 Tax=Ureibacillus chungkukjangi TaxID=1202712 RepID=A0A318TTJ2_9BACL|nr:aspartyl protease family protein [Ureibacillus chungkukjangi]MCM3390085.1 retroviral-like aspartic protease family protein [Ureibacillus chungkukjangi]PYF07247.1 gag-polyprotein putative aspartyl protease [Ureibacillus chungkukjangi]